ncbi:MAG TPA: class A beta-lactamase [Franconibacter pulveris]|nr:class A beta-lactamase [Franconibacter pulveris]
MLIKGVVRLLAAAAALGSTTLSHAVDLSQLTAAAQQEEKTLNARLGVTVLDTATGKTASYRGDERFPLNSTHKALLCGALLKQADEKKVSLTEAVRFDKSRLVEYSPVTEKHTAPQSMNWLQLCSAAVSYSDNTAANLISQKAGGPQGVNAFLRANGDKTTRLDRLEPALNEARPGDERDTTTPQAISRTLQTLLLGDALSEASRKQLIRWMMDDKVADALLRKSLPKGWTIADKTGAGGYGSRSIISMVWPEKGAPLVVAIYITQTDASLAQSNAAIARLGRVIFQQH